MTTNNLDFRIVKKVIELPENDQQDVLQYINHLITVRSDKPLVDHEMGLREIQKGLKGSLSF